MTTVLALAFGVLGAGCGIREPEEARAGWIELARGFTPAENERAREASFVLPSGERFDVEYEGVNASLRFRITPNEWSPLESSNSHRAHRGLRGYPDNDSRGYSFTAEGRSFEPTPMVGLSNQFEEVQPGFFAAISGVVCVGMEAGQTAPVNGLLTYQPRRGEVDQGFWHVTGRRFSGLGLSVWPGETARRDVRFEGSRVLRFAFAAESAQLKSERAEPAQVRFRVNYNGAPLLEHEVEVGSDGIFQWHCVELAPSAGGSGRLEFEVEGDFAYTTFFAPTIGPGLEDLDSDSDRPDIVVFLADTFRADNLRAYGGEFELAPYLEELAATSRVYQRAWSTSTFTLPSHASAFTGLHPYQAGIAGQDWRVAEELTTIAELLHQHGYRTGAITDSGYVSHSFGLDQGFEWFDELRRDMRSTGERIQGFLDGDDGRPTFLFIQTFDVHTPYLVSAETRSAWAGTLPMDGSFDELLQTSNRFTKIKERNASLYEAYAELGASLRALYLGGVVDFDTRFRAIHTELQERGLLSDGYFIFLSDHGESFAEHDVLFHRNEVYETELRIPLFMTGPRLAAGSVAAPVSLLDLAPTLADMAGMEPFAAWAGQSMLQPAAERLIFGFQCSTRDGSTWTVIDGERKWIGSEAAGRKGDAEIVGAFELDEDPGEKNNIAGVRAWPERTTVQAMELATELFRPFADAPLRSDDVDRIEGLRALGYIGEGDG